jgi:hypothetical protein
MSMDLVGVLPVSGVNLGLALAPPVLAAEISQFGIDLSTLTLALAAQLELGLNVPNLAGLTAVLNEFPPAVQAMFTPPQKFITVGADLNADIAVQLGLVNAALAIALDAGAKIDAAFSVGGIAGWCYSGPARGLATAQSAFGTGYTRGVMIATENPSSWGQFGASVNAGPSLTAPSGGPPALTSLGKMSGGEVFSGMLSVTGEIKAFLLKLQGLKANLELSLDLTLGLDLPDPSALLAILNELLGQIASLLDNLINVKADIDLEIGSIQARLDYILSLSASVGAQLSAGGLALWRYTGTDLGGDVSTAITGGIPGGTGPDADIRAVIFAHDVPELWLPFAILLGGI